MMFTFLQPQKLDEPMNTIGIPSNEVGSTTDPIPSNEVGSITESKDTHPGPGCLSTDILFMQITWE